MAFKKLITFGCSHTLGEGLEDCFIPPQWPGPNPSKFAWPAILANTINLPVDNTAISGASNLQILKSILEYKHDPHNIVVIMWTHFARDLLYDHAGFHKIGPWIKTPLAEAYYKLHSDEDMLMKSILCMHHADTYLSALGVKTIHIVFHKESRGKFYQFLCSPDIPSWFNVSHSSIHMSDIRVDAALDKTHFGPKSHELVAAKIYSLYENKYLVQN